MAPAAALRRYGRTPARPLRVAAVVDTLRNLINQGDAVLGAAPVDWTSAPADLRHALRGGTHGAVAFRRGRKKRAAPG